MNKANTELPTTIEVSHKYVHPDIIFIVMGG
jgi:hypothetical protein